MSNIVLYDADRAEKTLRRCGECSLCCKLLPVRELGKTANQRCEHQRRTGCRVYHKPNMPPSCYLWSCRWLTDDATRDLRRPDHAHYVIDTMPDFVTVVENATGRQTKVPVIQIWCDPLFPNSHRDPALREYLAKEGERGVAALVRFDSKRALHLFPPALSEDHQWHEITSSAPAGREHSLTDKLAAFAEIRGSGG